MWMALRRCSTTTKRAEAAIRHDHTSKLSHTLPQEDDKSTDYGGDTLLINYYRQSVIVKNHPIDSVSQDFDHLNKIFEIVYVNISVLLLCTSQIYHCNHDTHITFVGTASHSWTVVELTRNKSGLLSSLVFLYLYRWISNVLYIISGSTPQS